MNLGDLWGWEKRKLGCRIRVETQNPALDEIREHLSKMTGVEVPELDSMMGGDTAQRPIFFIGFDLAVTPHHQPPR